MVYLARKHWDILVTTGCCGCCLWLLLRRRHAGVEAQAWTGQTVEGGDGIHVQEIKDRFWTYPTGSSTLMVDVTQWPGVLWKLFVWPRVYQQAAPRNLEKPEGPQGRQCCYTTRHLQNQCPQRRMWSSPSWTSSRHLLMRIRQGFYLLRSWFDRSIHSYSCVVMRWLFQWAFDDQYGQVTMDPNYDFYLRWVSITDFVGDRPTLKSVKARGSLWSPKPAPLPSPLKSSWL